MSGLALNITLLCLSLSHLEHQYEQQQGRRDCVHLGLSGHGVKVSEGVPRVLQVQGPLLLGAGAAAQM